MQVRKSQEAGWQGDRRAGQLCGRHFVKTWGCTIEDTLQLNLRSPDSNRSVQMRNYGNAKPPAEELHFEISDQDAQGGILQGRWRYAGLSGRSRLNGCTAVYLTP